MKSFYNTINLTGRTLFDADNQAIKQEDIILEILKDGKERTPFEVEEQLLVRGYKYPITSIRRAMTNLTKEGKIIKTNTKKDGEYGKLNYCWKILDNLENIY